MKRSQSHRTHTRSSTTGNVSSSFSYGDRSMADRSSFLSSLGTLEDSNASILHSLAEESFSGGTTEDALRREVIEKDREIDKLKSHLLNMQGQLAQRPPLDQVQALEREYKNLEILLQGTQRENERCMAEMERGKSREKMLERELSRLLGDNWQHALEIAPSNTTFTLRGGVNALLRTPSGSEASLSEIGSQSRSPTPTKNERNQAEPRSESNPENGTQNASWHEATRARVEQLRLLILGMDQRLQTREEKLEQVLGTAVAETERFEKMSLQSGSPVEAHS